MKTKFILILLLLFSTVLFAKKAPDFTFKDLDGKKVSLSNFKGKVIIINFWATWCGPCIYEMPALEKLFKKYKKDGFQVIGLTIQSNNNQIPQKISQTGVTYPILLDAEDAIGSYGPFNAIPQSYLINKEGEIVKEFVGVRSFTQFEEEVKKLL
jgi:thiol-disulfide isomerase/thioredoxin